MFKPIVIFVVLRPCDAKGMWWMHGTKVARHLGTVLCTALRSHDTKDMGGMHGAKVH